MFNILLIISPLLLLIIFFIFRYDYFALILLFSINFSQGILGLSGIPSIIVRSASDLVIILLFFKSIMLTKNKKYLTFGLVPLFGLVMTSIFSFFLNNKSLLEFLLFARDAYIYYFFFFAVLNLNLKENAIKKINNYIIILFLIQLPAAAIKFIIHGEFLEGMGIGTISTGEGSLSAIMPMLATSFLFAFYLFRKKNYYLLLILAFLLFGVVNAKRAVIFFIPLILIIVYFIYYKKIRYFGSSTGFFRRILLVSLFSLLTFYAVARLSPTLNPDGKIGGTFDLNFALNYIEDYTSSKSIYQMRRKDAPAYFYKLLKEKGIPHLLMGMGPGDIVKSRFLENIGDAVNPMAYRYGVRYGGRTGALWYFIQLGFFGLIFFSYFHFKLGKKIFNKIAKYQSLHYNIISVGFVGAVFVLFIDVLFYSNSFLQSGALMVTYFYISGILLNRKIYHKYFEKRIKVPFLNRKLKN